VTRKVTALRGMVRSGNSGGPLVDARGRVVGTIFAATTGSRRHGGYAIPDDVVQSVLAHARHRVGTGPCAE
jgi:S1-C subfamily serine protease